MRNRLPVIAVVVAAASVSPGLAAAERSAAARLVGTWRLVLFEDVEDGKKVHPFGEKPQGVLIYTADGHMAAQLASPANPACVPPASKPYSKLPACTPEEMQRLLEYSVAYWGTYDVDAAAGVVVHHVKGDLTNAYTGTDQRRPFRLEGDRLVLGDGKTWTRIFERVR